VFSEKINEMGIGPQRITVEEEYREIAEHSTLNVVDVNPAPQHYFIIA